MDIIAGENKDKLVVGSKSYPILKCEDWVTTKFNTSSFSHFATVTASTQRTTVASGNTTPISSMSVTPLQPVDAELRQKLNLKTPREILQCFASDGSGFVRLYLEDAKL